MSSLFRSIRSNKQRDAYYKNEIIKELNNNVKEIQLHPPCSVGKQTTNEVTISLCTTLEALFLHGLKETILSKVTAMASDIVKKPECNFWSVALVFSHQEIIGNIDGLKLIRNDIGRCRAWLRVAMNDNLLVSYLSMMSAEPKSLVPYYERSALLRDSEKLGIAIGLLTGIMQYEFDLVVNSSLLNVWADDSLILAGTWSPPVKADLVASAMDVVQTIKDDIEDSLGSKLSLSSFASGISVHKYPDVSDDELLDRLTRPASVPTNEASALSKTFDNTIELAVETESTDTEEEQAIKNSLSSANEAKNDSTSDDNKTAEAFSQISEPEIQESSRIAKSKEKKPQKAPLEKVSYKGVLEKYSQGNTNSIKEIENGYNIDELLKKFQERSQTEVPRPSSERPVSSSPAKKLPSPPEQDFDFEILEASQLPLDLPEFSNYAQCLYILMREQGVKSQNYSCKQCSIPIGINFNHLCHFTCEYFCEDCFGVKTSVIPARIIYNWDFGARAVSEKASVFLSEIHHHPVFNIKLLNPRLYLLVEQMTQVHYMRMKLNHLKGYLLSCKTKENYLHVELWPREYIYGSLHLYSLVDLKEIQSGKLQILLTRVIEEGVKHVASCDTCKQKGHICELCNIVDIIFPFDLERTHTCRECRAVYHKACYQGGCPKCDRIRTRRSVADVRDLDDVSDEEREIQCDVEREIACGVDREIQSDVESSGNITKDNLMDSTEFKEIDTNGANVDFQIGSPCDKFNVTDDSISLDEETPVLIECIAEVHSVQSTSR